MKLKKLNKVKPHYLTTIYGQPGSGKTSLGGTLPGQVLVLDTDNGLSSVTEVERFTVGECENWSDVLEVVEEMKTGKYDSLLVDHLTNVQELCKQYVAETSGKDIGSFEFKQWGIVSQNMLSLIQEFINLSVSGKNVMILTQEKLVNIEGDIDESVPKMIMPELMASVRSNLLANSRIIGHTKKEDVMSIVKGKKSYHTEYTLRIDGSPVYVTKVTRPKNIAIPSVVKEPTWDKLMKIVTGQAKKKQTDTKDTKGE